MTVSLLAPPEEGLGLIAARIQSDDSSNRWAVVEAGAENIDAIADELAAQLRSLGERSVDVVRVGDAADVERAAKAQGGSALLLIGLDAFAPGEWAALDVVRDRLRRHGPTIMIVGPTTLSSIAERAPNFWSWVGGSVWRAVDDTRLTSEQREGRLMALRQRYDLDDGQVIARAEAQTLGGDPDFAEWLVLIGRGDLLRPSPSEAP